VNHQPAGLSDYRKVGILKDHLSGMPSATALSGAGCLLGDDTDSAAAQL
jgi:hypothetical protein